MKLNEASSAKKLLNSKTKLDYNYNRNIIVVQVTTAGHLPFKARALLRLQLIKLNKKIINFFTNYDKKRVEI